MVLSSVPPPFVGLTQRLRESLVEVVDRLLLEDSGVIGQEVVEVVLDASQFSHCLRVTDPQPAMVEEGVPGAEEGHEGGEHESCVLKQCLVPELLEAKEHCGNATQSSDGELEGKGFSLVLLSLRSKRGNVCRKLVGEKGDLLIEAQRYLRWRGLTSRMGLCSDKLISWRTGTSVCKPSSTHVERGALSLPESLAKAGGRARVESYLMTNSQDPARAALQRLIDDGVMEGRRVDYKLALPERWNDEAKKEFLADVSSFANTEGGDLYYGIREKAGVPVELVGVDVENLDHLLQLIENLSRDGIAPRLQPCQVEATTLESGRVVLILRIARSWALPHMVAFKGHDKFYARTSAGKYKLDVTDLRSLFVSSEAAVERLRRFRLDRLSAIRSGEAPLPANQTGLVVVHLLPLGASYREPVLDLSDWQAITAKMTPLSSHGSRRGHNLDGLIALDVVEVESRRFHSYVQLFSKRRR